MSNWNLTYFFSSHKQQVFYSMGNARHVLEVTEASNIYVESSTSLVGLGIVY